MTIAGLAVAGIDACEAEGVPTAEDVIVQKLRWARDKDLMDATDVLVVQDPENLDVEYIRRWCREHGIESRLDSMLGKVLGS